MNPILVFIARIYPHRSIDNPVKQCFGMPELIKRKCKNPDAYLDEQDLKDIAESEEDIRQGKVFTHEEVGILLGFRK
ncbi:MAG: hypothetical protein STSR0009_08670 [Methanoregula sp.]